MGAKQQLLFDIIVTILVPRFAASRLSLLLNTTLQKKEKLDVNYEYTLGNVEICEVLMLWING
jgi:hypothetical protein